MTASHGASTRCSSAAMGLHVMYYDMKLGTTSYLFVQIRCPIVINAEPPRRCSLSGGTPGRAQWMLYEPPRRCPLSGGAPCSELMVIDKAIYDVINENPRRCFWKIPDGAPSSVLICHMATLRGALKVVYLRRSPGFSCHNNYDHPRRCPRLPGRSPEFSES